MSKKLFLIIFLGVIIVIGINQSIDMSKKLEIGDSVPSFTLKDQNNNDFNIDRYRGKQPLVIYFYPKDDTPGCTKEACSFRDEFEVFTDLNVVVIGISSDNVTSHKKFAEKYHLPFTLLADTEQKVQKSFGVPRGLLGLLPGRVTYVIDNNGIIIHIFNSQFDAEKHITEAISSLNKIEG